MGTATMHQIIRETGTTITELLNSSAAQESPSPASCRHVPISEWVALQQRGAPTAERKGRVLQHRGRSPLERACTSAAGKSDHAWEPTGCTTRTPSVSGLIKRALAQRPQGAAEALSPFEVPLRVIESSLIGLLAADTRTWSGGT